LFFQRLAFSKLSSELQTDEIMLPSCPNSNCPFFSCKQTVNRDGRFFRKSESRFIQRFKCSCCKKKFSHATGTLEFGQKKRRVNSPLKKLLSSGVSMRRCARVLNINRLTVERKFIYLAKKARLSQAEFLKSLKGTVTHLQFDDLITIEHTKLKPLTVAIAVDAKSRFILGARVGRIGAFGHLAELSRRKYGKRKNEHMRTLFDLFVDVAPTVAKNALVRSDEHQNYPGIVERFLPTAKHETFKGERGAVTGQGELKKVFRDPLFAINHTCAMLRANVNRLIRKTWCTSKHKHKLQLHLDLFIDFYNQQYLRKQL
jgi:transposase-like protein